MATLPRLAHVTLVDETGRFCAEMEQDGQDTMITIGVDDKPTLNAVTRILAAARAEYQVSRKIEGVFAGACLGFNRTSFTEAVGLLTEVFSPHFPGLLATYWYEVSSGGSTFANLGVQIGPEPNTIIFRLPSDDTRNSPELWERLDTRITDTCSRWRATTCSDTELQVTMNSTGTRHLEETVLMFVKQFSFS